MNITRIAGKIFQKRQKELERHLTQGEVLQQEVLMRLISRAKDTEYGRNHLFSTVKTYDDFAHNLPISSYEELNGETDLLWPSRIKWYAKSSGTTNDKSKFIPVSSEGLQHIHYAGGFDTVAIYLRNNPKSRILTARVSSLVAAIPPTIN